MKQENPVGKRRERQKAETYELILESARVLFETQGFKKSTIRAVATHAEIGLGTIYKHFDNKNSLLAAAFYDDLIRLFNKAISTIPTDTTIQVQLVHMAKFNYNYYTSRPKLSREYLKHIHFVEGEWSVKMEAFEENYANQVTKLISAAQKRGEIKAEKNCHFVALSFMANYFLVLSSLFLKKKIDDPEEMLSFLRNLIDQTIC